MRVTFINRMMGIRRGGGEYFDLNIARALRSLGVDVRFIVGRRIAGLDLPLDDFETHYIKTPYLRNIEYSLSDSSVRILRSVSHRSRLVDDRLFELAVLSYLKNNNQADIYQICIHAYLGSRLTRMGCKAVIRWPGPPGPKAAGFARDCVATFTHGKSYEGAVKCLDNVHHIVAGCDTDRFKPSDDKVFNTGRCKFLFTGRCIPVKNLKYLAEGFILASKQCPGIELCIVGEGETLSGVRSKIADAGLSGKVEFAGFCQGKKLVEHYRNADCFVLVSQYESFSIVTLEAMASGLPVILSDTGNLPFFIKTYAAGALVELNNVQQLANTMVAWANNSELRHQTSQSNRQAIVRGYSWTASAEKLLKLYENILTNKCKEKNA